MRKLLALIFSGPLLTISIVTLSLITSTLAFTPANAAPNSIEIISISEVSSTSVEILFNSSVPKKSIANYVITAAVDPSVGQAKNIKKIIKTKSNGLITAVIKNLNPKVAYKFSVSAKTNKGKMISSEAVEYYSLSNLMDVFSNLPVGWGNPTPIPTPTPTQTATPIAAPAFTLSASSESRTVNTAATGFTINSTGGAIASFAISATPAGMSFNTTTGALTGTPITVAAATAYTVTATNATGSATTTFTLTVTVTGTYLYYTNSNIQRIGRASTQYFDQTNNFITPIPGYIEGLAISGDYIFWTSENSIVKAKIDGMGGQEIIYTATPGAKLTGIAIYGVYLYWVDLHRNAIGRAFLDGSSPSVDFILNTSVSAPGTDDTYGIFVTSNYIYWANYESNSIGRAKLDGTGIVDTAFIRLLPESGPTAIWATDSKLIWTNYKPGTLGSSNLEGTIINQSFISIVSANAALIGPYYLVADSSNIYWTNYWRNTIGRASLDGNEVNYDYLSVEREPVGICLTNLTSAAAPAIAAAITTQPTGATSGSVLGTQPVIRIVDANGNTVTGSSVNVVASIASGTGTLSGTTTVAAVAGIATFTNLVITGTAGNFTLTFTPTSLIPITSSSLAITAGAATKVAITRASVGTSDNVAFTTQPQITIQDASGNTVSSSDVVTATISGAGGTLIGTTTATASSGVATFTGLGIDGTPETTYTITYTVSGLTVATATVTLTLPCAAGGTCIVGDTGPGGGIVFYVAPGGGTFACGPTRSATCRYLEAAPTSATTAWFDAAYVWSGNTNTAIGASAQGTEIGTGYANTLAIVQNSNTPNRAATIARAYTNPSGLSDWFLPSKDELNQMCKWQRGITGVDLTTVTTICSVGIINTGSGAAGFVANSYWSSSEVNYRNAWYHIPDGRQNYTYKEINYYVRPVRAF